MENLLLNFFEEHSFLKRLHNLEVRHINALFFSTQQIFAVACYNSEEELLHSWERAAHQLAHKVQNNLPPELDELRWDIYLILYVDQFEINNELKKLIENNRFFFRKIIITKSHLESRLNDLIPLEFNFPNEEDNKPILFNDKLFLKELKGCLSEESNNRLGESFFNIGINNTSELISLFDSRNGGNKDEN